MKQESVKNFASFLLMNLEGKTSNVYRKNAHVVPSALALILWIFLNAWGFQQVYQRLALMDRVIETIGNKEKIFQDLRESDEFKWPRNQEKSSGFLGFGGDDEEEMSPAMQAAIASLVTVLALVLFLRLASVLVHASVGTAQAVVASGASSIPLSLGMLASYAFFHFAESVQGESLPGILFLFGVLMLATGVMSAFIILYMTVFNVLDIKERARYLTTVSGVFVAVGVFGWISRLLID